MVRSSAEYRRPGPGCQRQGPQRHRAGDRLEAARFFDAASVPG